MRTLLLILMLAPPVIAVFSMLLMWIQASRFMRDVPSIRTADDLARFKRLAKIQMYVALVVLPLLWLPIVVWLIGHFVFGTLGWVDLLTYVILPWMLVVAAAFIMGSKVKQVQDLPATDRSIGSQRDHVVDVWLHRRLPDW
jgi:hypothetical protein